MNTKVFDWDKAARIIRERKGETASAGLIEDWTWTSGVIWEDGKPVRDDYTYLASFWATPVLKIGEDCIPCWTDKSKCRFNEKTKWPEHAVKIVNGEAE